MGVWKANKLFQTSSPKKRRTLVSLPKEMNVSAVLAQLVERTTEDRAVAGSKPADGMLVFFLFFAFWERRWRGWDELARGERRLD